MARSKVSGRWLLPSSVALTVLNPAAVDQASYVYPLLGVLSMWCSWHAKGISSKATGQQRDERPELLDFMFGSCLQAAEVLRKRLPVAALHLGPSAYKSKSGAATAALGGVLLFGRGESLAA